MTSRASGLFGRRKEALQDRGIAANLVSRAACDERSSNISAEACADILSPSSRLPAAAAASCSPLARQARTAWRVAFILAHQLGNTFHTAFISISRNPIDLPPKIVSVGAASLGPLHVKGVRLLLAQLIFWRYYAVDA